jgi:hypothetical protein
VRLSMPSDVPICRVPRVWVGQPGGWAVVLVSRPPRCARVSARRSRSGSRYRRAMCWTRSGPSVTGIPAVVMNIGRTDDPGTTGTAWVAVRNLDLATLIIGMANSACARAPRSGRAYTTVRPPGSTST